MSRQDFIREWNTEQHRKVHFERLASYILFSAVSWLQGCWIWWIGSTFTRRCLDTQASWILGLITDCFLGLLYLWMHTSARKYYESRTSLCTLDSFEALNTRLYAIFLHCSGLELKLITRWKTRIWDKMMDGVQGRGRGRQRFLELAQSFLRGEKVSSNFCLLQFLSVWFPYILTCSNFKQHLFSTWLLGSRMWSLSFARYT